MLKYKANKVGSTAIVVFINETRIVMMSEKCDIPLQEFIDVAIIEFNKLHEDVSYDEF